MFTFRKYNKTEGGKKKKGKHPKLIVDKKGNQFGFMGLTESKKRGRHNNVPIKNPQQGNSAPAYIRDELRYDHKDFFGEPLADYELHESDLNKILFILNKRKEKQKMGSRSKPKKLLKSKKVLKHKKGR